MIFLFSKIFLSIFLFNNLYYTYKRVSANEILNKINIMRTNQNVIYKYKYVLIGKKLIWVYEN